MSGSLLSQVFVNADLNGRLIIIKIVSTRYISSKALCLHTLITCNYYTTYIAYFTIYSYATLDVLDYSQIRHKSGKEAKQPRNC